MKKIFNLLNISPARFAHSPLVPGAPGSSPGYGPGSEEGVPVDREKSIEDGRGDVFDTKSKASKDILYTVLFFLLILASFYPLQAQVQLQKVSFTTGGSYQVPGNQVEVACYEPFQDTIMLIDSVPGDFSNAVLAHEGRLYAHIGRSTGHPNGEDAVYVYDLKNSQKLDSIHNLAGLKRLKIHDRLLLITRGFGASGNYFQIYALDSLSTGPIYNDSSLVGPTQDVVVLGDHAYLSYTAQDSGRMAIIKLTGPQPEFVQSVAFDTLTSGLDKLYTDGSLIYGLAERAVYPPPTFAETIISAGVLVYNPLADTNHFTSLSRARDGIGLEGDYLYANYGDGPGAFDLLGDSLVSNQWFPASYTVAKIDSLSGDYHYQATDYFSFGALVRTDGLGMISDSINTDISGSALDLFFNHKPVAVSDSFDINTAGGLFPQSDFPLANDFDLDSYDSLFIVDVFGATLGSFTFEQMPGYSEMSLTYTPFAAVWAIDTFYYVISDGWAQSYDTVMSTMTIFQESAIDPVLLGGFEIYPNPAGESVVLEMDQALNGETELIVWNLHGQIQFTQTYPQLSRKNLNLQNLPAGWYYVEIRNDDQRMLQKLMKQ